MLKIHDGPENLPFLPRDATQSAVVRLHVVCLSVRPSVCPSVRPWCSGTVIT